MLFIRQAFGHLNRRLSSAPHWIDIRPRIRDAVMTGKPVVAFETAIVTHGLPKPINYDINTKIGNICAQYEVIPATVGFIDGRLIIGLSEEELKYLAAGRPEIEKIARLDIAKTVAKKLSGGTTVSMTMWAAHHAGIKIFVTGGIGGVHRGWQESMDISSDLTELGRTPVVVICAGSKSILDIPATLEYLETMGVPVATLHRDSYFPAFYSTSSGVKVPFALERPEDAVDWIRAHFSMNPPPSGMLIANPIPEQFEIPNEIMEVEIRHALKKAKESGVSGKATTPFLLSEVRKATAGRSVETNIELVLNNTNVGCRIASSLSKTQNRQEFKVHRHRSDGRPVIVGGSVLDAYGKFSGPSIDHTRATEAGRVFLSAGGVGRNVADCISRVMGVDPPKSSENADKRPLMISVLADDSVGNLILSLSSPNLDMSGVKTLNKKTSGFYSPSYVGTLANTGQYLVGIGDFIAMEQLDPEDLSAHEASITVAPLAVIDGNMKFSVFPKLMELCSKHEVPLYVECTDIYKATRIFLAVNGGKDLNSIDIPSLDCVAAITPNFEEFLQLTEMFLGKEIATDCRSAKKDCMTVEDMKTFVKVGKKLVSHRNFPPNLLLKLGPSGVIVMRRCESSVPLPIRPWTKMKPSDHDAFSAVWYGAEPPGLPPKIVSVSGAGDCFIGTILGLTISGSATTVDGAIRAGLRAACLSLENEAAVPDSINANYFASKDCLEWCSKIPSRDISNFAA